MALNIKDPEAEKLAAEVASITGESKTAAVREALRERRDRCELASGGSKKHRRSLRQFLETEIWPQVPDEMRNKPPMTKEEREEILGIGPEGF